MTPGITKEKASIQTPTSWTPGNVLRLSLTTEIPVQAEFIYLCPFAIEEALLPADIVTYFGKLVSWLFWIGLVVGAGRYPKGFLNICLTTGSQVCSAQW